MDKLLILIVFVVQIFLVFSDNIEKINVKRDAKLSAPELIKAYGYPSEVHNIVTEDGYILETHRIANPGKQPVILMHGMLDSSATWILTGPKRSLGYILHDQNYDVWMPNTRGNDYSIRHKKYNRNGKQRKKYWNFSWHEIGKYDVAASIDYVLANTSYPNVFYIGHSQGATTFFVLTSERPEYNDKILLMVAMAPPVFMTHVENSFLLLLNRYLSVLGALSDLVGLDNFTRETNNMLVDTQNTIFCSLDLIRNTQLCKHNFSPLVGNVTQHVDKAIHPVINTHAPAGASMKQLIHFGQLIRSPRFHQYDYGVKGNLFIYNRTTPPEYSLKNCTARVAIIYSDHDTLTFARDVLRLPHELPNLMAIKRVEDDTFNHIDFVWANDAKELVYDYVIDWMRMEEKEQQMRQSNGNM